jgi:putative transposase
MYLSYPRSAGWSPSVRATDIARITALLNRERRGQGLGPVNRKRVLRIMQANALVLTHHTAYRPARTHEGVVIALRSNIRWCSDHLELTCRNGDVVRILFVIEACDREIIAWSAVAHAGVSGEMVRDLGAKRSFVA